MANRPPPPTLDSIRKLLIDSDRAVEEAVLRIQERQTDDEQRSRDTTHNNGRGWSKAHAPRGGKYAGWIRGMRAKGTKPGECLQRADHKDKARAMVLHYVGQLLEEAAAKYEANQLALRQSAELFHNQQEVDENEAQMDKIVRESELLEARNVARFKAIRDANLQQPAHPPCTRVTTYLQHGYPTLEALEMRDTLGGDSLRIKIYADDPKGRQQKIACMVIASGRLENGQPANCVVLVGGRRVWHVTHCFKVI